MLHTSAQPHTLKQRYRTLFRRFSLGKPTHAVTSSHRGQQSILQNIQFVKQMIKLKDKTYIIVSILIDLAVCLAPHRIALKENITTIFIRAIAARSRMEAVESFSWAVTLLTAT